MTIHPAAGIGAAAIVAGVFVGAPFACAHDSVIGSNPENGGVIAQFPDSIKLEFSGELEQGFNTVALSRDNNGSTEVLYSGEPVLDGRDVILPLPADLDPQPGDYKVGFQIISSDGHSTKGMTSFTYAPDGAADQALPENGQGQGDVDTQGATALPYVLGLLGLLAVGGAAFMAMWKRKRAAELDPQM